MNSPHLTAARLMLTELESQLREPVNLYEVRQVVDALVRHLDKAEIDAAFPKSYDPESFVNMPVLRAINTILNPAPR